ncbi:MAG: hypothetical protein H7315_08785 [Herminiimonas sp.]|nr:hypothetical protein [Herminiimonas sp.]
MLRVSIHAGDIEERCTANQLAVLDIAYDDVAALATYVVALKMRGTGSIAQAKLEKYPRWAGSIWLLVARSICQVLYRKNQLPPSSKVDKRCAYATRICAVVERATASDHAVELGRVEISQRRNKRGCYTATFDEDILGARTADFDYGCKALNHSELLMRAICWAYYGADTFGPDPALIIPPTMMVGGVLRFHVAALAEPAMTGFRRYLDSGTVDCDDNDLPNAELYAIFLANG